MRLRFSPFVLLATALATPLAAHADMDTFTVTGTGYSLSFDLPSTFPTGSAIYTFNNVMVDDNGTPFDATVSFYNTADFTVQAAANLAEYQIIDGSFYTPGSDGSTFNQGSHPSIGNVNVPLTPGTPGCNLSWRMPGRSSLPTLALLEMPSFSSVCNDPTSIEITSAAPEPPSLLLLGTGVLGVLGIGTRRLWS